MKNKITAIVVCRNEAHHLDACLKGLRWVDELLVVNMESTDNTLEIASKWADKIISHGFSPIVEPVRCVAATHASNDWLLFVDPDEHYPEALAKDIQIALSKNNSKTGIWLLPMKYYFKGQALDCSPWGRPTHHRPALVHRHRSTLQPLNFRGRKLNEPYVESTITPTDQNHIQHYWMDSYRALFSALCRYAPREGQALYELGHRFGFKEAIIEPLNEFRISLVARNGLKSGPKGLILSLTYSLFTAASAFCILPHQFKGSKPQIAIETSEQTQRQAA